jgi:hypothetical protein
MTVCDDGQPLSCPDCSDPDFAGALSVLLMVVMNASSLQKHFMEHKPLVLTEALIDGDDPAYAALDVLLANAEGLGWREFTEHIRSLPQHWRAIYTTLKLEDQVCNGGHHQFFWNGDGALNKETLEDLRLISAKPFILLFEEALDEYQRHDYAAEKRDSGNSKEAFLEGYKEKRMENLDTAYYKAPTRIRLCLADYIRSNRNMYL